MTVFVVLVVVYGLTGARTITGFGDSDELIAAGYNLALPHQPGYPLMTALLFMTTRLPLANPALLGHRLAGTVMALVVSVCVVVFYHFNRGKQWRVAVAVGLIIGGSGLVWRHGNHLEVFGLMGLFSITLLWGVLVLKKHWFWWGVVAGLGLGHHQLLLLTFVPQLLWVLVQQKRRFWPIMAGLGLGVVITLVGIGLIGWRQHPDSWQIEVSVIGVVNYFLRSNYSGYSMGAGETLSAYVSAVDWVSVWHSWGFYLSRMWQYWGWWNLAGLVGLFWGRKIYQGYWLILICFVTSGPVLAGYLTVNQPLIVERMYVLSQFYWGLLIGFGLILTRLKWVWLLMSVLWVMWMFPQQSLANYVIQERYIEGVFEDLPDGAALICLSDASCFGSYYYQSVLGKRTDVLVLTNADQFRFGRKTAWAFGGFDYLDNPFRLGEAVGRATFQGRPIYVTQLSQVWITELGLNDQAFLAKPDGIFRWKIERPEVVNQVDCGNDSMCELRRLSFGVWREPNAIEPRLRLAEGFERYGLIDLAKRERLHVQLIGEGLSQFPGQSLK
ncbi:MAG TPA: DUF2723 domain-containing protein [Anaerolineales bacterium]|nr:DUF2723 domain-containing protein [Anaerolineales bacterium]